jgi:myo-inositol-1(or 4)-monophosphatase
MQSNNDHQSDYLKVAEKLARRAGSIIKAKLELGIKRDWKSDQTPVTQVDKEVNQLVIETIHVEFPQHSILAEEGSDLSRSKEFVWVCDPIDGTFPFMHGIPVSTFTLALVHSGQPILGVIYDPFMDRMFMAEKGQGSTLNGKLIHTASTGELKQTSIGAVFWQGNMDIFTPLHAKLTEEGARVLHLASIAYMDALVACGEFVATVIPGLSAHDSAAAKIIVEEAGGVFTSLTGEVDRYDQPVHGHIAAANQAIYDQIQSLLR